MTSIHPDPAVNRSLMSLRVLTPHETVILGGSGHFDTSKDPKVWHTPEPVLEGKLTVEEAREKRRDLGYYLNPSAAMMLGLRGRVAISLEDLDPQTGETVKDPHVLGLYDEIKNEVIPVPGRDLTTELRGKLKEFEERNPEEKFYLREIKQLNEGNNPGSSESKH